MMTETEILKKIQDKLELKKIEEESYDLS